MILMSDTLRSAICEQIGHEIYNANLYLYICGFLRNKGLDNLSKLFEHQYQEESKHSIEFFNLLTDLNADVIMPEIEEINMPFESISDIANTYLVREVLTTTTINQIKIMAIEENNPVVEEKMRHMIAEQQKEYEEASTFLDKSNHFTEWWQVAIWDSSIGG